MEGRTLDLAVLGGGKWASDAMSSGNMKLFFTRNGEFEVGWCKDSLLSAVNRQLQLETQSCSIFQRHITESSVNPLTSVETEGAQHL